MPKRKRRKVTVRKPKTSAAHMRHEREEERIFADFLRSIPAGRKVPAGPHTVVRKGRGWSIDGGPVMALMAAAAALHGRYKRNPRPELAVYRQTQLPLYPPERFEEMGFPPGYEPVSRVITGIPPEARAPYTLEELGIPEDTLTSELPPEVVELLTPQAREILEYNDLPHEQMMQKYKVLDASRTIGERQAKDISEEEWERLTPEQQDLAIENEKELFEEIREELDSIAQDYADSYMQGADLSHIEDYFSEQVERGHHNISRSEALSEVLDHVSTDFAQFVDDLNLEDAVTNLALSLVEEWAYWTFHEGDGRGDLSYQHDENEGEFEVDELIRYGRSDRTLKALLEQLQHPEEIQACYDYVERKLNNGNLDTTWRGSEDDWHDWKVTFNYSEYAYARVNWNDVAARVEEQYEEDYNNWVAGHPVGVGGTPALPGATAGPSRQISAARLHRAEVPHVYDFGDTRSDGTPRPEGYQGWYAVELQLADLPEESQEFGGQLCFNNSHYRYKKQLAAGVSRLFSIRSPEHRSKFVIDLHLPNHDCWSIDHAAAPIVLEPGVTPGPIGGIRQTHSADCPARRGTLHISQVKGNSNRHAGWTGGTQNRFVSPDEVEIAAQFVSFLGVDPLTVSDLSDSIAAYERHLQAERDRAAGILPQRQVDYRYPLNQAVAGAKSAEFVNQIEPTVTTPSETTVMMVQGPRRTVLSWNAEKPFNGMRGAFVLKVSVQGQRGTEERVFGLPDDATPYDYWYAIRDALKNALLGEPLPPQMNPRRNPHCNPRRKRNPSVLTGATQSRPIGKMKPPKMTFWDFYEAQAKPRKAASRKRK